MQYFLRKLDTDWCDEFSTFGMKIYDELEHTRLVDALNSVKEMHTEWGFGSNQYHEGTIANFIKDTEVHLISGELADIMEKIFPNICKWGVGSCSAIEDILEDSEKYNTPAVNEYWRYVNSRIV